MDFFFHIRILSTVTVVSTVLNFVKLKDRCLGFFCESLQYFPEARGEQIASSQVFRQSIVLNYITIIIYWQVATVATRSPRRILRSTDALTYLALLSGLSVFYETVTAFSIAFQDICQCYTNKSWYNQWLLKYMFNRGMGFLCDYFAAPEK